MAARDSALVGERKREAFLRAVRAGSSVGGARGLVGWSVGGYAYHRRRYADWAALVDEARVGGAGAATLQVVEGVGGLSGPADFAGFAGWAFGRVHHAGQLRLAQELGDARPGEVVLFLTWRGAGKTTTLEDFMCRKLALEPDHRFCIVSRADRHAKNMVERVKRQLTDTYSYPEFIARYGPFYDKGQERRGSEWAKDAIRIAKRKDNERDPNIVARAWTSAAFGSRIDTLLVDDVIDRTNVNQSETILEVLQQTYLSSERAMRTVIVGNRIADGDLYHRLIDSGIVTRVVILPAAGAMEAGSPIEPSVPAAWEQNRPNEATIVHDGHGCCPRAYQELRREVGLLGACPGDGSVLGPQEMMLKMRARVGERVWHATFQQTPQADELSTFAGLLDRCLDRDRGIGLVAA